MNPMPDLRPIIASLRSRRPASGTSSAGAWTRRPRSTCTWASSLPTGQLGVLLRLHRRLVPPERDLPGGAGFAIQIHAIAEDVKDIVNLGIFCTDTACEDIFLHFMDDIVSHLLAETRPEAAMRAFLARVSLWQRFFVQGRDVHLSEEAQVGLFAELLLLRRPRHPGGRSSAAVDAWKGPEGKPQDFVLAAGALGGEMHAGEGGRPNPDFQRAAARRAALRIPDPRPRLGLAGRGRQSLACRRRGGGQVVAREAPPLAAFNDRLITAG